MTNLATDSEAFAVVIFLTQLLCYSDFKSHFLQELYQDKLMSTIQKEQRRHNMKSFKS